MALIEKIEINAIKEALKQPYLYVTWMMSVLLMFLFTATSIDWILLSALAFCLSLILVVDIKHYIIPDTMQFAIFIIANLLILTSPNFDIIPAYAGAGFGFAIFYSIYYVYENIVKKPALGFGDVKLFANAGLILGFFYFNNFLLVLTAVSFIVLLIRMIANPKEKLIPYGPMISISIWLCIVFRHQIDSFIHSNINNIIEYFI